MFSHIFVNRFKCLIRDKQTMFWTLMFPIVLASLFSLAFSNLSSEERFSPIAVAVVNNVEYQHNQAFQTALAAAAAGNNGPEGLFEVQLTTHQQAEGLLKENKIAGYILMDGAPQLVVRIPAGFSQSLKSGQNSIQIEKTSVDQSLSSVYLDFLINRYLSTARLYIQNVPGLTDADLLGYIKQDMTRQTRVEVKNYGQPDDNKAAVYYTYLVYAMIAIMFLGVTSIMLVFNDTDLKRRNLGSPLKAFNMNLQLFLGNLSFALMVWMIMLFIGLIILRVPAFSINSMLLYINLLCLTLACLSLSFLIGNLISSRYAQQAIVNVLSLGLCFISGVFVPQQLLGHTINLAASFTPTYWYVKAVNDIDKLVDINAANIAPIINSMLIQLGFVVAFLTVTLAIAKQKRVSA